MPKQTTSALGTSSTLMIAVLVLSGGAVIPLAEAEIYQYIDARGTISLTNVPSDQRYRRVDILTTRLHPVMSERELEPVISRYSLQHQLHPALIRAVIKAESDFDPMAVSRAGAAGLMQLMPQT